MILWRLITVLSLTVGVCSLAIASQSPTGANTAPHTPTIISILKPNVYREVLKERVVATHASFEKKKFLRQGESFYEYYMSMLVRADFDIARNLLVDASIYARIIPFVNETKWDEKNQILDIKGGVLGYTLVSKIKFTEKTANWLTFQFIGGHFMGMNGNIHFEDRGEKGTLVWFGGQHRGQKWPPKWIMTYGGEIALSVTGRKMRKYVESQAKVGRKQNHEKNDPLPKPRGYLRRSH